jgi:pimeloyl-ACP methyl ester carboxylesterase/tetratricopeptide (TPR) repeat protein
MPYKTNELLLQGHLIDVTASQKELDHPYTDLLQVSIRQGGAVSLRPDRSGKSESLSIAVSNEDVVQLTLEGDLQLYTSIGRFREDVFGPQQQRGGTGESLIIPRRLVFANQVSRDGGGLLIEALKILDIKSALIEKAGGMAVVFSAQKLAELIEKKLVGGGGLMSLKEVVGEVEERIRLEAVDFQSVDLSKPILLFLHGTGSSITGSFSELWCQSHDDTWQQLRKQYQDNILALQHRTLTESPIDNAVQLLESLPAKARLHIVSHSRGGLIGELICRGQLSDGREPFTAEDIGLFQTGLRAGLPEVLKGELNNDYRHHQGQLQRLNALLIEKQLRIERFIRVGCPARGTTLASGKLDIYLSGILNIIGQIPFLKSNPVYDCLKVLTLGVAKERTNAIQLPGLEAQMPESPLIAMLNATQVSSQAPLAVIEGNIEPAGIMKKIALFFLDQFYESDHDLVVNTPSMDGGAPRVFQVPVMYDEGKAVNHFQYFSNSNTRTGLLAALTETQIPPSGFSLRKQRARVIARSLPRDKASGAVPVLFVLPGMSGSHLAVDGNRIWIAPFNLMRGSFTQLQHDAENVMAQDVVASVYGNLVEFFSQNHEVIPFPYDWRRSVLDNGRLLAAAVDERLRNTSQPVRIIAHSMGGLVFRGMAAEEADVWNRMRARDGSRVLMLGTPNRGSYSIPRIFARQDRLIRMLAIADLYHDHDQLLGVLRRFQGILELLPVDSGYQLPAESLWLEFQEIQGNDWKRPLKKDLKAAQKTWQKIADKGLDPRYVFYIAGRADETPESYRIVTNKSEREISFFSTAQGDGQVTWKSGIPMGMSHWYVDAIHGDIPDHEPAYRAMLEILERGDTQLLSSNPPLTRSDHREMLPDRVDFYPGDEDLYRAALCSLVGTCPSRAPMERKPRISVAYGDLCFAKSPIAVGHYQGDTIVSAEAALDSRLKGRLSKRLQLDLYPGPLMTNEVLFNFGEEHFPGAVIIGLGEVGTLTPGDLTDTFREAVLRYVVTRKEYDEFQGNSLKLSSLLIGTGAGGLSPEDAMTAMLRALMQANRLLAGPTGNLDNTVESLTFIELYEDVAVDAVHQLNHIADHNPEFKGRFEIERLLIVGDGGCSRVYYHEDPSWWQRLRINTMPDGGLKFTSLTTRGARAEMIVQPIQRQSVTPFLKTLTGSTSVDSRAGRTLFELLIPREFKVHAREHQDLVLVVDDESAAYPWELLEFAGHSGDEPMIHKSGIVRQLAASKSDPARICNSQNALVVGDPLVDDDRFTELPGAQSEALIVHQQLFDRGFDNLPHPLINKTGSEILTALMTGEYQILHLAGHGVVDFPLDEHQGSLRVTGMVIGKDHYLTPVELRQMPVTPAFVFINCCHLGSSGAQQIHSVERPYKLASNLAIQLIHQGVRAVIAAGWAVDDAAAETFAREFYRSFLSGDNFGEAIKSARRLTYDQHGSVNTWGAYQCYGDPGYVLKADGPHRSDAIKVWENEFVAVSEYLTEFRNIAEKAKTASPLQLERLRDRMQRLIDRIPRKWQQDAQLLETLGRAWGELDVFEEAIQAYRRALCADPANASIHCAEQLSNLEARYAVQLHEQAIESKDLDNQAHETIKQKVAALLRESESRIHGLNAQFGFTVERLALTGGFYKRQALVVRSRSSALKTALIKMAEAYKASYEMRRSDQGRIYTYPLTNWLTVRWLLNVTEPDRADKLDDFDSLLGEAMAQSSISDRMLDREHFWSAIEETDCILLQALKNNEFEDKSDWLCQRYKAIRRVSASPKQFRSVEEHLQFLRDIMMSLGLQKQSKRFDRFINCARSSD